MSIIKVDYGTISGGGISPTLILHATTNYENIPINVTKDKTYVLSAQNAKSTMLSISNANVLAWDTSQNNVFQVVIFKATSSTVTINESVSYCVLYQLD